MVCYNLTKFINCLFLAFSCFGLTWKPSLSTRQSITNAKVFVGLYLIWFLTDASNDQKVLLSSSVKFVLLRGKTVIIKNGRLT